MWRPERPAEIPGKVVSARHDEECVAGDVQDKEKGLLAGTGVCRYFFFNIVEQCVRDYFS